MYVRLYPLTEGSGAGKRKGFQAKAPTKIRATITDKSSAATWATPSSVIRRVGRGVHGCSGERIIHSPCGNYNKTPDLKTRRTNTTYTSFIKFRFQRLIRDVTPCILYFSHSLSLFYNAKRKEGREKFTHEQMVISVGESTSW